MNNKQLINTFVTIGIGYIIGEIIRPKQPTRRSKKQIETIKNNSEIKGYDEGYTDGKKDYKPKKKKKK